MQIANSVKQIMLTGALLPLNNLSETKPAPIVPKTPTNGKKLIILAASAIV